MRRSALILCGAVLLSGPVVIQADGEIAPAARRALAELADLKFHRGISDERIAQLVEQGTRSLEGADSELAASDARVRQTPTNRAQLRASRCAEAFLRGELNRAAAEALPVQSLQRDAYAQAAIEVFRILRVECRNVAAGGLGYIGESRVHRAMERLDSAAAALEPLLATGPHAAIDLTIRRLAVMERLETQLAHDPAKARSELEAAARSTEFRGREEWQPHLAWLNARAAAALADDAESAAAAAELIRSGPVSAVAHPFERLRLLAALDERSSGLMRPEERLAWADRLAAVSRTEEAVRAYEAAVAEAPDAMTPQQWLGSGRLLLESGRHAAAADRFQRALDAMPGDAPARLQAQQYLAAAMVEACRRSPEDRPLAEETRQVLLILVGSSAPVEARRIALRQWIALAENVDSAQLLAVLREHAQLADGDPWTRYARLRAEWESLRRRRAPTEQAEAVRHLVEDAQTLRNEALAAGEERLAASAILLEALIVGSPPLDDALTAVAALEASWSTIAVHDEVVSHALALRIRLLLKLGLIDVAGALLAEQPEGLELPPPLLLDLAGAMAEWYAPGTSSDSLRKTVVSILNRATAGAAGGRDYADTARRAAKILLQVEAFPDAQRLIAALGPAGSGDHAVERAVLEAQALRGRGEVDAAVALLHELTRSALRAAEPYLILGELRASLAQHDRAIVAYREARRLSRAGSDAWWDATLGLTQALGRSGQGRLAQDILRSAAALYPAPDRPTLQARVTQALRSLEGRINISPAGHEP